MAIQLLEFHYWTDVVMAGIVITAICSVFLVVIGLRLLKRSPIDEDKIRQQIFDSLTKTKEDLEKTV